MQPRTSVCDVRRPCSEEAQGGPSRESRGRARPPCAAGPAAAAHRSCLCPREDTPGHRPHRGGRALMANREVLLTAFAQWADKGPEASQFDAAESAAVASGLSGYIYPASRTAQQQLQLAHSPCSTTLLLHIPAMLHHAHRAPHRQQTAAPIYITTNPCPQQGTGGGGTAPQPTPADQGCRPWSASRHRYVTALLGY